ncbi:Permease of the drug/metabolite transporter (DMT) superfamily [Devosia enhydra]|uniref:Permease of the drug/metabolite transporter (DMT) superfamily n=1 Tax=Devosia enhydra TaxID=665118 RepID=A0A1K2HX79_9HYPH|nr:DMT family transporter [Devosia enhydra]SFZ82831.1 Permease of the drug/metabolite transporter (DMT) superfamily [Devosia enhydra]
MTIEPKPVLPALPPIGGDTMRGIGLKVASICAFVGMMVFIKIAGELPVGELLFFRCVFSLLPMLAMLAFRGQLLFMLRTRRPIGHVWRGFMGTIGMGLGVISITQLPLPESVAISFGTPLLVVILSAIVLHETVRLYRWGAVAAGLFGMVLIVSPRLTVFSSEFDWGQGAAFGVVAAITACFFSAAVLLIIRKLVQTERSTTIVLYFFITSMGFSLLTLPWGWVMPTAEQWLMLLFMGLCSFAGQMFMTEACRHADMSVLAPFDYLSLILSGVVGYLIFAEVPTWQLVAGGVVIIASGLFIIWRERQLGRATARSVAGPPGG